ncbi:MAG TPA: pentapeptide repeat-containing protein [Solirubrobacterales bacterium]
MSSVLTIGREEAPLDLNINGTDALYAADRVDDQTAEGRVYKHCTFANVSFKDATLRRCRFVNCAFIDCYFRQTTIANCAFEGCKFIDCNFLRPNFLDNTFILPEFRGCYIPFDYFGDCLPLDSNLRYELAAELAREASAAGVLGDARRYRLLGEKAFERHQWNLLWASGGTYYEKDRPPLDRAKAGTTWVGRKFNRLLWGYGERGVILARSFFGVAVLFALIFGVAFPDQLTHDGGLTTAEYLLFSFDNMLAGTGFSQIEAQSSGARWAVGVEVFVGLIFIGLFVSLVFNWIRRR